jgi:8-oxo-dGTP pyrophosphatase MutT (NUDIX family)
MNVTQIIENAVCLKNFDTLGTRIAMSPLNRIPERPAELPGDPRCGAVMAVLFTKTENLHVILIKRHDDLRHHPGQISFPGGRREQDELPLVCALRETHEEIGISPEELIIAGGLEPAYICASDFVVHPFVAWHPGIPSCIPDPREVTEVFPIQLSRLCPANARTRAPKNIFGTEREVPGFSFSGHHIWGATAMLLHEILERLKAAGWRA